ncbi:hypothetical protein [Oceanithermus sp.]
MKKFMAFVLSVGLVLLGTTQVMAIGQVAAFSPGVGSATLTLDQNIAQVDDVQLNEIAGGTGYNKFDYGKNESGGGGIGGLVAGGAAAFAAGYLAKAGADAWDYTKRVVNNAVNSYQHQPRGGNGGGDW